MPESIQTNTELAFLVSVSIRNEKYSIDIQWSQCCGGSDLFFIWCMHYVFGVSSVVIFLAFNSTIFHFFPLFLMLLLLVSFFASPTCTTASVIIVVVYFFACVSVFHLKLLLFLLLLLLFFGVLWTWICLHVCVHTGYNIASVWSFDHRYAYVYECSVSSIYVVVLMKTDRHCIATVHSRESKHQTAQRSTENILVFHQCSSGNDGAHFQRSHSKLTQQPCRPRTVNNVQIFKPTKIKE